VDEVAALRGRLFCDVREAATLLRMSERTLRQELGPGGTLEHLAFRPSPRRVLVRVAGLLEAAGIEH
jgi:hypothetical protein